MAYTVNNFTSVGGSLYGDLSVEDALTIQSKMLPIAKKHLTFGRFAQKDSKGQNEGNVIRHRRYKKFSVTTVPLGEGVTPDFDTLESEILTHTVKQFGRYTPVTDLMMLLGQDPYIQIITDRQAIQAAETMDKLAYHHFRAPSNCVYAGGVTARASVVKALGTDGAEFDACIRFLENNDAVKMTDMLSASPDTATEPIRAGFIAICHPNFRQDLERITGFVPVEKYADSGAIMDFELGSYNGIRFIATTQATPFDHATDTTTGAGALNSAVDTTVNQQASGLLNRGSTPRVEVYPIVIFAKDSVGTATIGGMDSIVPKVVRPTPSGTDPLGQRGTVGYTFMAGQIILNEDWMICVEAGIRKLGSDVTAVHAAYSTNN